MARIIIDLTTLARWQGTTTGIPRCQSKYAGYALRNLPGAVFTLYDARLAEFRVLSPRWAQAILEDRARIDLSMMPDPTGQRKRTIEKVPAGLREIFWWITQTRRKAVNTLEQWRLRTENVSLGEMLGRLQRKLMSRRRRHLHERPDGSRVDWPSFDFAAGEKLRLTAADTIIAMQADWAEIDVVALARAKEAIGFRHVVLCHDIIPIQFPQWYSESDVTGFKAYWDKAFEIADRVMFTSRRTAVDAAGHANSIGVSIDDYRVVPLGADVLPRPAVGQMLPPGIAAGKYILFVSTIEPRKNHRILVDAWRRLIADGTVAASGYKLVFVGRKGWMMDDFVAELNGDPELKQSLLHLSGIDDAALSKLYADAGFCVYPPKFEGFGLPPIEALAAGKALIVSNAGPIPEVVGDFALCLDPDDLEAWTTHLRDWINGSPERERYARRARENYRPLGWDESARMFFDAAMSRD